MRILDTDIAIAWLRGHRGAGARFRAVWPHVGVSIFSVAELFYGASHSDNPAWHIEQIEGFLNLVQIVPFDLAATKAYGAIRQQLVSAGTPIDDMDMLIASVAISKDGILVTHNSRHFSRVSGLLLEDWLK